MLLHPDWDELLFGSVLLLLKLLYTPEYSVLLDPDWNDKSEGLTDPHPFCRILEQ